MLGKLNQDASVVCLTSAPAARYKSDTHLNDLDVPFGRSVATSAFSDSLKVARLQRPNIVDGVAAASNGSPFLVLVQWTKTFPVSFRAPIGSSFLCYRFT